MTDLIETRVENLEPKKTKKVSAADKKSLKKTKKRNREDYDSSVVESSKESIEALRPSKKNCILNGKCSHITDSTKIYVLWSSSISKGKEENF